MNFYWFIIPALLLTYVIIKVVKTEVKRKKWLPTLQIGTECSISVIDSHLEGTITEVNDNEVTVEVKVCKRFVYPLDRKDDSR